MTIHAKIHKATIASIVAYLADPKARDRAHHERRLTAAREMLAGIMRRTSVEMSMVELHAMGDCPADAGYCWCIVAIDPATMVAIDIAADDTLHGARAMLAHITEAGITRTDLLYHVSQDKLRVMTALCPFGERA